AAHIRIVATADVAERDERVPTEVSRIALGDVPATVARHELVVGCFEQRDEIDPRTGARLEGTPPVVDAVGRAHLLAVVAPVDARAERSAVLDGERPRLLH